MKKTITLLTALAASASLANAATIVFNFNTPANITGAGTAAEAYSGPDSNNFGAGVTVSAFSITDNGSNGNFTQNNDTDTSGKANAAGRNVGSGSNSMSFSFTIADTVTVDLSSLSFNYGYFSNATTTTDVGWTLAISTGTATPSAGAFQHDGGTNYQEQAQSNLALSSLTGLTDTTVTFTWTLLSSKNNSIDNQRHTLDNITLTGTATAIPEPSSTALLGLAGLGLILRRRR